MIANASDTDAFTLEDSEHYAHWTQNFADECGYLRDPNHVLMKVEYTRATCAARTVGRTSAEGVLLPFFRR